MDEIAQPISDKIKAYSAPAASEQLVRETKLLLIAGPAGSGKDTIIKELLKTDAYEFIISHTTRPPRSGEQADVDYYYIDAKTAKVMVDGQRFFEVKVVYDGFVFGTSTAEIQRIHDSGKIGVTDIDIAGVKEYVDVNPDTKAVFILPPSYDEWVHRLVSRGTGEDQDAIHKRLIDAQKWLEEALEAGHFQFVINANLDKAVADIRSYVEDPNFEPKDEDTRVEHAWHVLGELKQHLNS